MVNNRRSEFEIISKILDLSRYGAKKTEILYQANLSYAQLNDYLALLVEKNFVIIKEVKNNGSSYNFYLTTDKGNLFLADINKTLSYFR